MDYMGQNIALASDGDRFDIVSLFLTSDPRHSRSVAYYDYSNNTVYGSSTSVVAKNENDSVIAHYSILPLKFKYHDKVYNVGYAQQAIVHSNYRDLQLISELHEFAINKVNDKLDFVFAFSNDNFFKIKTQLFGWSDLGSFSADEIDLRIINFKINHKVECLNKFDSDFDTDRGKLSLVKSKKYLNQRLLSHPINHYKTFVVRGLNNKVTDYIALKFYKRDDEIIGHFIDYEASSIYVLQSLIAKSREYFAFYGVYKVIFWNRSGYQKLFDSLITGSGFVSNFIIKDFNNNNEILDKDLWDLSMILSDAF